MARFVHVKNPAYSSLGTAKVIDLGATTAAVSWFDSPLSDPIVERVQRSELQAVHLERQTRVYWLDRSADAWRVGRVLDADTDTAQVRFANHDDRILPTEALEVRWDRPVADPCAFLAERITESPAFAEARARFARTMIRQRGACGGMSGLISSVIALEPHQVEVVRRVLRDPVQRYLLADEVGLGKTIEAGVLMRQYVLDDPDGHRILVLAPPALVVQWQRELRARFLLGYALEDSIQVLSLDAAPEQLLEQARWAGMLVIDEAHHLSDNPLLYRTLREAITTTPRLLLLSATPVLHNERGFLEMLHLLDPDVFPLSDEAAFRKRIEHRQGLAEAVAGLVPENLLQLDVFLDDLAARFPDDDGLRGLIDPVRAIAQALPDESDPALAEALSALRAHLTETYRLDRRILRNRRRDLSFLTPRRAGLTRIPYHCVATARLVQAIDAWRTGAAASVYGREGSPGARVLAGFCHQLVAALMTDPAGIADLAESGALCSPAADEASDELARAAREVQQSEERMRALLDVVQQELQGRAKLVIFCTLPAIADAVAGFLARALPEPVERHRPASGDADQEQPWEQFCTQPDHRILVCDAAAEEGLNLQGGAKVVIHYDLPLAPNRIEQRLGRADRYGSADPIRSIALCCADDPYATAWADYLEQGLGVFERSIASLQYLIDDELRALTDVLLVEGIDALRALTERTRGPQGTAARELRRIEDQDALDALAVTEDGGLADLDAVDGDWRELAASLRGWLTDILQVETEPDPPKGPDWFGYDPFRFCFRYQSGGQRTLIPMARILSVLLGLLDTDAPGANSRRLKTCWYGCRRPAAQSVGELPEGLHLVRWGDELVDRIQRLMDLDDRGRAAALWRMVPDHVPVSGEVADVFLRFDFIVETDIDLVLREASEPDDWALRTALARRGDMALPPFYQRVWIDGDMSPVVDSALLERLEAPYLRAAAAGPYRDWNLNWKRWPLVEGLGLPVIGAWREWLPRARQAAEVILHRDSDLAKRCERAVADARQSDQGRFAQLRARVRGQVGTDAAATLALLAREERIASGLYAGMRAPQVTLGTVVAVFLSAQPLAGQDA
jgi:ATP-dependent helicase HepA